MSALWSVYRCSERGAEGHLHQQSHYSLSASFAAVSKALHAFRTASVTYQVQDGGDFRIEVVHSHREGFMRVVCITKVEIRSFRGIMRVYWPLNW
jgi:hypothetical protein